MTLSSKWSILLRWALLIFFIFLIFPFAFYYMPDKGLDPSWMVAIHLAIKNKLIFGKDFVFTYGPLSAFRFRYPMNFSKYAYLVSDLYFVFILFIVLRRIIRDNFRYGPIIFLFMCVLLCQYMEIDKWFFFCLFFFLFSYLKEPRKFVFLVHAGILSIICLYIKVNSGIVDIFFFLAALHYVLFTGKLRWPSYLIALGAFIVTLVVSAHFLHTDLRGYILGSLAFIKDYPEVMFLPLSIYGNFGLMAGWSAIVIFFVLIVWYLIVLKKWISNKRYLEQLDTVFIYGMVAAGLFVWYKNGFVRADTHVYHFFEMVGPLVLLLYLFTPADAGKKIVNIFCWVVMGLNTLVVILLPSDLLPNSFGRLVKFTLIPTKIGEIKNYFTQFNDYDRMKVEIAGNLARPNKYKDAIGNATVDIIPSEISTIYFKDLHYDPRPALQSYAAYDLYLDGLDYNKYMSDGAPDYVLFTLDGMDDRFAWTDEARVKLALINRYRITGKIDDQLLLKKVPTRRMIRLRSDTMDIKMGEEIPVKKGADFVYAQFFVDYNLVGKLVGFVYQPYPLKITYTLDDGDIRSYKAFRPVLADGMILNKFVDNTREFQLLLLSDGKMNTDVRSIRIDPASGGGGYKAAVKMITTSYQLESKTEQEQLADSLAIDRLVDGNAPRKPLLDLPADSADPTIHYGIEGQRDHSGFFRLKGWVMREKDDNSNNTIRVLAKLRKAVYELPSEEAPVHEFPLELRQRKDLDSVGFNAIISKSQLPAGYYRIGLAMTNRSTGSTRIKYIDRYMNVGEVSNREKIAAMAPLNVDSIKYRVDVFDNRENNILVQGWAILENAAAETNTDLILQSDTVTFRIHTDSWQRPDVMQVYKNPFYEFSGFSGSIVKAGLPKGIYNLGIEKVTTDGKIAGFVFCDRIVKIGFPDYYVPARIDVLPSVHDFNGNIDEVKDSANLALIAGWASDTADTKRHEPVLVALKNNNIIYTAVTELVTRPDLAEHTKDPAMADCGFSTKISKGPLPNGKYQIGICICHNGKPVAIKFFDQFITK